MTSRVLRSRLAVVGLGVVLGSQVPRTIAVPPSSQPAPIQTLYLKTTSFRIPFHVDPAERARRRELQLWVSEDSGASWRKKASTTPDRPSFSFQADHNAEYWFAVRTVDTNGRLSPGDDSQLVPNMKVVVDTIAPGLTLLPESRSASLASIRWEIREAHPDLASLSLEYQAEGMSDWQKVPIDRPGLQGVATWDAGTTGPIRVRGTIADRSNNGTRGLLVLSTNAPGGASSDASEPKPAETPASSVANPSNPRPVSGERMVQGSQAPGVKVGLPGGNPPPSDASAADVPRDLASSSEEGGPKGSRVEARTEDAPRAEMSPAPQVTNLPSESPEGRAASAREDASTAPAPSAVARVESSTDPASKPMPAPVVVPLEYEPGRGTPDMRAEAGPPSPGPIAGGDGAERAVASGKAKTGHEADPNVGAAALKSVAPVRESPPASNPRGIPTIRVPGTTFAVDYSVEDAGPEGPSVVELWVTKDGSQTWRPLAQDPDRVPPFAVELEGEGTYGLCIIARDAKGQGDRAPTTGDPPQMWVEVGPGPIASAARPARGRTRLFRR